MPELIEDVLPFLVAFFVLDGLTLVRRFEWLLLSPWGRFRGGRSGPHLVGLSPGAELVSAFESPIRLGRKALHVEIDAAGPGEPPDLRSLSLDGVSVAASERRLEVGGLSLTVPSAAAARHLAAVVSDLRDRRPHERDTRLRALLREATDLRALRVLRTTHRRFQRILQWLGLGLWIVTFVLLPLGTYWKWQQGPPLATVLLSGALLHAGILLLSWTALRRLGMPRGSAASTLIPLLFFPPAAAHAGVHLFRDLYVRFDPLAVAGIFLRPDDFKALARAEVRRLRHEAGLGGEVAEWAALREKAWTRLFADLGTSLAEVLRPPAKKDDAASYCPLCGGEYRAGYEVCAECRVPLEAMA